MTSVSAISPLAVSSDVNSCDNGADNNAIVLHRSQEHEDTAESSSLTVAQTQVIQWTSENPDLQIAQDMSCLSSQERDYVLDDIHGV